jgi:hypothetical protein
MHFGICFFGSVNAWFGQRIAKWTDIRHQYAPSNSGVICDQYAVGTNQHTDFYADGD